MTVSVLLVLGEKGKALVDEDLQEQWYLAYIGKKKNECSFLRTGTRHPSLTRVRTIQSVHRKFMGPGRNMYLLPFLC